MYVLVLFDFNIRICVSTDLAMCGIVQHLSQPVWPENNRQTSIKSYPKMISLEKW